MSRHGHVDGISIDTNDPSAWRDAFGQKLEDSTRATAQIDCVFSGRQADSVEELGLAAGVAATAVVKATSVMVERGPEPDRRRSATDGRRGTR